MPKTFRKVSPIKYRQILETVEKIIVLNNEDEKNELLNELYTFIHPFVGTCDNPHYDWRELLEKKSVELAKF